MSAGGRGPEVARLVGLICMARDESARERLIDDLAILLGDAFFSDCAASFLRTRPALSKRDPLVAQTLASEGRIAFVKLMRDYPAGNAFFSVFARRFEFAAKAHLRSAGYTGFGESDENLRQHGMLMQLREELGDVPDEDVAIAYNSLLPERSHKRRATAADVRTLRVLSPDSEAVHDILESAFRPDPDSFVLHPAETAPLLKEIIARCHAQLDDSELIGFAIDWLDDKLEGRESTMAELAGRHAVSETRARMWQTRIREVAVGVLAEMGISSAFGEPGDAPASSGPSAAGLG